MNVMTKDYQDYIQSMSFYVVREETLKGRRV